MIRKTKEQKAITLIALIITIVVLLILAAVAIASITNDGVLGYAENAATQYNQAVKNEQDTLQGYIDYLNKHNGSSTGGNGNGEGSESGNGSDTGATGTVTVGTIVTENSTINGEEYSANNPIIPAGFKAINTETSKWDDGDLEDDVKNGLVISDGTSEFVWIPVADINEMAKVTSGVDANGRTNYEGKFYDFTSAGATDSKESNNYDSARNEPSNIIDNTYGDNASRFTSITWTETYYQEAFNKMVESVAKYKGFYVGRYEMSLDGNGKAQSKAGETSSTAADSVTSMWFGLYDKATTYSNLVVTSEMIWGCQWDAMVKWMQGNNIYVTSTTPIDTARGETASRNITRVTGSDSNDLLNNIYDLLGNSFEWTQQEGVLNVDRVGRGGSYQNEYGAWVAYSYYDRVPTNTYNCDYWGSRLTLYVN